MVILVLKGEPKLTWLLVRSVIIAMIVYKGQSVAICATKTLYCYLFLTIVKNSKDLLWCSCMQDQTFVVTRQGLNNILCDLISCDFPRQNCNLLCDFSTVNYCMYLHSNK